MGRVVLSVRDRNRLAELEQELADLRSSPHSESVSRRINELMGTDFTATWGFDRAHDRHTLVNIARSNDYVSNSYFDTLKAGLQSGSLGFLFSLRAVDPKQRNRALHIRGLNKIGGLERVERYLGVDATLRSGYLSTIALLQRYGLDGHAQLRTVLCDGSLVVGYLNMIQPGAFTARQRRIDARVSAALGRRLVIERRLARSGSASASLATTLEALGRAAFIIDDERRIVHANALGELALQNDRDLRASLEGIPASAPTGFDVIAISSSSPSYLALRKTAELSDIAAALSTQLDLGHRARSVLLLAVTGETTKEIATRLALAENTVEYHLSGIFRRLDISSRAELYQVILQLALKGTR